MSIFGSRFKSSKWLRASLQPATLLGLMVRLCWAAVIVELQIERGKTMDAAVQQSANFARLFEETTVRTLEGVDRTLFCFARLMRRIHPISAFAIGAGKRRCSAIYPAVGPDRAGRVYD